jgi:hypothetical protein
MAVDVTDKTVKNYQTARLKEKAAPKTINEEVDSCCGCWAKRGEPIRARLRRQQALKLAIRGQVGKAYAPEEKTALLAAALAARSPGDLPRCCWRSTRACGMRRFGAFSGAEWICSKPI